MERALPHRQDSHVDVQQVQCRYFWTHPLNKAQLEEKDRYTRRSVRCAPVCVVPDRFNSSISDAQPSDRLLHENMLRGLPLCRTYTQHAACRLNTCHACTTRTMSITVMLARHRIVSACCRATTSPRRHQVLRGNAQVFRAVCQTVSIG